MTLLQLSYFLALAENLHYTKTAESLHISQPSLSYAILNLEKELGVALFHKEKQTVSLTPNGHIFYPYVKKTLETLNNGRRAVQANSSTQKSVVHMGYFHSISTTLIPSLIEQIQRSDTTNHIQFELIEDSVSNLVSLLKQGKLDLCFTCHKDDKIESVPIGTQPLYLAVPKGHRLAERTTVCFQDFSREQQVMLTAGSDLRAQIDQLFADNDEIPQIAIETRECNAALQYVVLNFGVSVLPQVPVMDRDNLSIIPIVCNENNELSRTIYFAYQKSRHLSQAAHLVKDYILSNLTM